MGNWEWIDTKRNRWPWYKRPLVELFDTGRVGTGVCALEPIEALQVLDPYLGEIYPLHKKDRSVVVPGRYGDAD